MQHKTPVAVTDLQNLILVEIVEVVFPLAVLFKQQVEEGNPDLAVKFGDLQTVLTRNLLPSAIDVLLQRTLRGSQRAGINAISTYVYCRTSQEWIQSAEKSTLIETFPRAAVNQLHQHTGHVMRAQHAIDYTDAVKIHWRNRQRINAMIFKSPSPGFQSLNKMASMNVANFFSTRSVVHPVK